jgi:prepilin-type N-terminal cleavage/methylation domain-containing protein
MKKLAAFSLIELIVTTGIIGVLSTIGTANFQGYSAQTRNAQTIHIVGEYVKAFRTYQALNDGAYPPALTVGVGVGEVLCLGEGNPGGTCGFDNNTSESADFNNQLRSSLESLPPALTSLDIRYIAFPTFGPFNLSGTHITYRNDRTMDGVAEPYFFIEYYLEGNNVACQHAPLIVSVGSGHMVTTTDPYSYGSNMTNTTDCVLRLPNED